jgi:hypothetical protein
MNNKRWYKYAIVYPEFPCNGYSARKTARRLIDMEEQRGWRPELFMALPEGRKPEGRGPRRMKRIGGRILQ